LAQGKQQDHDIRIEPIAVQTAIIQMIIAAVGGLVFGLVLKNFTDAAVPMLDSQLAAFSLLATYWTSRKHIATWILWVFVDIVYVGMFIYKELFNFSLICSLCINGSLWLVSMGKG
jgi:nicotinamide mononucleotide transporter